MATGTIYNSALDDLVRGNVDADTDTFYALITTSAYTPDKDTHLKRSDVTNEVAAGGGYSTGGVAVTLTVTKDTVNDRIDITLGGFTISSSTITGRKVVYYKRRGGASSADELIAVIDQGADVVSTSGNWTQAASTLRIQN
jgi:hypothetical protein